MWSSCCSLFFKKEMELSLIGLQNAGKTSLVNVIASGAFHEDMIPTVGFNMRKVTRGAVTIKLWDLGGQVINPNSPSPARTSVAYTNVAMQVLSCSADPNVHLRPVPVTISQQASLRSHQAEQCSDMCQFMPRFRSMG